MRGSSEAHTRDISEPPTAQFAKTMGISDATMRQWCELIGDTPVTALASPRDVKLALARSIVARYHGEAAAAAAVEEYERKILVASGLAPSRTRANDLKNNAVAVDGVRAKDNLVLAVGAYVVRSGKNRFARVTIK